jgi:N-acetyl-gamma-glutamyl-phosphate reductase
MELGRGLLQHPYVESLTLGINESKIHLQHWLPESIERPVTMMTIPQLIENASQLDVVFLATPAEASVELAPAFLKASAHVIDVSGGFRLENPSNFREWYGFDHKAPELLKVAHYGLSPFVNFQSRTSTTTQPPSNFGALVANPGCYATAVQMALIPLLKQNLLILDSIVIDAKSGTTGAGKKASESQLFAEVEGECLPYKVGKHQHFPEICEHIEKLTQTPINPMFSTTLIPVRRGIIAGIYARLQNQGSLNDVAAAFDAAYSNYPLVRHAAADSIEGAPLLSLKKVVGSARTHITYKVDNDKLYLYSSIDNLMKGAATQAIENMNQLWGWPVHTGLLHREGLL